MADTKQQWYKDAKYGLFIHWGLYSILAGEWKDPKTGEVTKTDRIAEWIENNLNIDKEDYRKLKDEFHPDKFDADMFVKRAKEQWGVKYIVLTSKHHEGFAMYDSKVSDFNVVKAAGRDILRELSDACKKYDMTMGIYYSQAQDWDDDNAYKKDYEDKNEWKPEFRTYFDEKCKPQLKELLENYDNISLIWFDTPMGMTADEAQELRDWVKRNRGKHHLLPLVYYGGIHMAGKSVPKVKQKLDKKDLTLSLAFLLPAILITVIFVIYPVFDTVGLSFRKWNGMFGAAKQWVGLENYQKIFSDKLFWNAMLNSVYFMIGGFVILMPLSFGLAMLVTAKIKGTGFFRTCYFLPNMLGTTAVALMWTFMLNPNFGIFNTIENIFGLHGTIPDVLTIKTVNVWIVVLVNEWMYAGYNMLIFAAGLVAIPDELNEAAALDGATGWQRIRYIILPLMKNSFKVFSILCITGCLKVFDIIWAMTRGGPNDISSTPSIMLYTQGFSYKLFGRSSAYGVILLVLGVVLSLITNHLFREDKDLAM